MHQLNSCTGASTHSQVWLKETIIRTNISMNLSNQCHMPITNACRRHLLLAHGLLLKHGHPVLDMRANKYLGLDLTYLNIKVAKSKHSLEQ